MRLIYDIAVMAQLVAACETANNEINKAEQLIQQVHSHSDWTCKEKSVIDELMQECKKMIQRMREDQSSFMHVLKEVEGELNDTESSISSLFQGVESILGKVLSIPVAESAVAGAGLLGGVAGVAGGIAGKIGDAIQNGLENVGDVINSGAIGTGWAGGLLEQLQDIGSDIMDTEVIWHGPPEISFPSGILENIDLGSGLGAAHVLNDPWHEAWQNNPNLPHNKSTADVVGAVQDAWTNIGEAAQPITGGIGTWAQNVGSGKLGDLWDEVAGSDVAEAVKNVVQKISEPIPICQMVDVLF